MRELIAESRPGLPEKATHDYVRHGTTTLFAALEIATRKHPAVQAWLARNPRITMHFTPASRSWLNRPTGDAGGLRENQCPRCKLRGVTERLRFDA
jgi:hypothetical protein